MIKHVVWEIDGTLIETFPATTNAILASLADHGFHTKPELVQDLAKISVSHCLAILAETCRISTTEIIEGFNQVYTFSEVPNYVAILHPHAVEQAMMSL